MSTIEERVKQIVVEQLGVKEEDVSGESSFVDDLGADSLDTVELVMALEEEFNCEIPMKKPKKSRRFVRPAITSTRTPKPNSAPAARRAFRAALATRC